ncbi:MAG: DUF502 domain-containing protein [Puniceicoccales bacterium]|jgi:uncharacterized membrane protein|nr:DUF502 domain-containing protein [Puniceicoccales bacterium]
MMTKFKRSFIAGLFVLLPLGVTFFVIQILLNKVGQPASALFFGNWIKNLDKQWVECILNLISVGIVILFIACFGWFSQYFLGKCFLKFTERLISNVPFINSVYKTVKQLVDTLAQDKKTLFQKAVLVEFPRKGLYSVGFLTSDSKGEIQEKTSEEVYCVFVPTTPNPTTGFLIMVPKEHIITLDMSIGDAMKIIISGGAIVPPYVAEQNKNNS